MRRNFIICLLTLLIPLGVQGRVTSFFDFSAGAGWSTLTYSLQGAPEGLTAKQLGSYNMTFHVGYGMMFNSYVGLGIGVDMSRYGAKAGMKGQMWWNDVTDTDGEKYNHCTSIGYWNDRQELYYVEVPLTLYFAIPTPSAVSVSAELGVKYAYPFIRNASYSGEVTHSGQYPMWGVTLTDMPNHGFTTEKLNGGDHLGAEHQIIAFAKVGVLVPLSNRVSLFAHVFGTYGFRGAISQSAETHELGFRGENDDMHDFMQPASSVLTTNLPEGSFCPVSVGLEIGVRVHLASRSKEPCRCITDDYYYF